MNSRQQAKKDGYILVTVLAILSLAIVLVTRLLADSTIEQSFTVNALKKLKAQQLAMSGIEIAKSIIQKQDDDKSGAKQALEILKYLNQWHLIDIKEDEQVVGKINFYLAAEDGKCNINKCLKFGKNAESKNTDIVNSLIVINKPLSKLLQNEDIYEALKNWSKTIPVPLNEISQLIMLDKMSYFKDHLYQDKTDYSLNDIFSLIKNDDLLDPWLFSASICKLLSLKTAKDYGSAQWREELPNWLKKFSATNNWESGWDEILAPIYGKKLAELPLNIVKILKTKWDPKVFSVIVNATFDNVSYSLFAIIEADKTHRLYLI